VYPTNFTKARHELQQGSRSYQKLPKPSLKVYTSNERRPYMDGNMGETIQFDNVERYKFTPTVNADKYNQKVIFDLYK
jgi:hypothetical protein